jgi:anti-sigma regulatory factor (Ser/Thr protein kinase)
LVPTAQIRNTTLPFQPIEHTRVHSWLEFTFSRWMCGKLGVTHGGLASLRAVIKDLFQNVVDHSTLQNGFIHVQQYPKVNQIGISISDFGCGIPANVKKENPGLDDAEAIMQASMEGFTTKSVPNNMGLGLDNLIRNVTGNEGSVSIYSYRGVLHCSRDIKGITRRTKKMCDSAYPGTLIDIRLDTTRFEGDFEEEGDMEW